jgi:hypothetical protein
MLFHRHFRIPVDYYLRRGPVWGGNEYMYAFQVV